MMWLQKPPLGVPLDWSNPLNKGLKLHLANNEGHGTYLNDLSMNGNHGTIQNMAFPSTVASGWNPGRAGVGLNYDGIDDYVDCGNDASLDITDAITFSAWIKPAGTGVYEGIIGRGGWDAGYWISVIQYDNCVLFYLFGVYNWYIYAPGLYDGNWHNTVFTYDKDAGSNNMVYYVDGALKASQTRTGTINTCTAPVQVGDVISPHHPFHGSIDQVRILNRAMTAKEVMDYAMNPWGVYLDEDD